MAAEALKYERIAVLKHERIAAGALEHERKAVLKYERMAAEALEYERMAISIANVIANAIINAMAIPFPRQMSWPFQCDTHG